MTLRGDSCRVRPQIHGSVGTWQGCSCRVPGEDPLHPKNPEPLLVQHAYSGFVLFLPSPSLQI